MLYLEGTVGSIAINETKAPTTGPRAGQPGSRVVATIVGQESERKLEFWGTEPVVNGVELKVGDEVRVLVVASASTWTVDGKVASRVVFEPKRVTVRS